MPIYEFECPACGERFDRLQKLSDPDPDTCPQCGKAGVRRRMTAPSFRLSGSGWYETDFKKDGDKKRNLVDKPQTSSGDNKASDAKAAAAEAKPAESKPKAAPAEKPAKSAKAADKPPEK